MSLRGTLAVLACAFLVVAGPKPSSATPEGPRVQGELVSEVGAITPGQTFWVALYQRITPGWHTYWVNPGDSGEPPRIAWAFPEKIPVGPAMTFGYSHEVVLPIPITSPQGLIPGTRVTLRGQASWLVCEKTCIPEEASMTLTLPVTAGAPPPDPRGAPM